MKRRQAGERTVAAMHCLAEHAVATDGSKGIQRATVCLEAALMQAQDARMLPKTELETRLRLGDLLARGNSNDALGRARLHLDRAVRPSAPPPPPSPHPRHRHPTPPRPPKYHHSRVTPSPARAADGADEGRPGVG